MSPAENPYFPPASDTSPKSFVVNRACEGLLQGAGWGSAIGLARGAIAAFSGTAPWYVTIGGSLITGLVIGGLVCAVGRAITGRLSAAWLGSAVGLVIGVLIGNAVGGYHWTTSTDADGNVTGIGTPIGQIVGSGVGLLLGAILGAVADRVVRGPAIVGDPAQHSSSP